MITGVVLRGYSFLGIGECVKGYKHEFYPRVKLREALGDPSEMQCP